MIMWPLFARYILPQAVLGNLTPSRPTQPPPALPNTTYQAQVDTASP